RRDSIEDQDRGGEETAADSDHAGEETDQPAQADDHQRVHRQARDRQVDVHWGKSLAAYRGARKAGLAESGPGAATRAFFVLLRRPTSPCSADALLLRSPAIAPRPGAGAAQWRLRALRRSARAGERDPRRDRR